MRYLSVCAGIEAFTVAAEPLGFECAGVSEIDKFPRAVLEQRVGAVPVEDDHRWQEGQNFTPLFGDFTKIEDHHVGPVDLLVGGTPCQSFSIAGKRLGLDDPRGNLALEFLALARRVRARFILWENVPGVLSHDEGRTFGTFLGFVEQCGFRWAYRTIDAQYVRVGRFGRAVPQRRRRVFLVGYSGTAPINPAAVLFDRESLRGNPAPRRQAGQGTSRDVGLSLKASGGFKQDDTHETYVAERLGTDFDCDGGLISQPFNKQRLGEYSDEPIASTVSVRDYKYATDLVAHSLRGEGFNASEDGTGRGTPIVPVVGALACNTGPNGHDAGNFACNQAVDAGHILPVQHTREVAGALTANYGKQPDSSDTGLGPNLVAFTAKDHGGDAVENISPTLRAGGHAGSHANAGVMPAVAFKIGAGSQAGSIGLEQEVSPTLTSTDSGSQRAPGMLNAWGVRRLTPTECERLQGFPDGWTAIPWRGKTAENCPDGPRYKALGNSMAVNVMVWIAERLKAVSEIEETLPKDSE